MMKKLLGILVSLTVILIILLISLFYRFDHKTKDDETTEYHVVMPEKNKEEKIEKEEDKTQQITSEPSVVEQDTEQDERTIYRLLDFDRRLILKTGEQDKYLCSIFTLAYARAILDDNYASDPYAYYDGEGAVWRDAGFADIAHDDALPVVLKRAYDEINEGRPTIFYVSGTYGHTVTESRQPRVSGEHFVMIMGYRRDADYEDLKPSDFYVVDPSSGYKGTEENYIPWVILSDEAPEFMLGEYALFASVDKEIHLPVTDAYADMARWDADLKEVINPEYVSKDT